MILFWSPAYLVARFIVIAGIVGFYKRFERAGLKNIPKGKPIIFAPNHQSGFMDPVVVATHLVRQTHFLVRADVFSSKTIITIFKWLKMMPVYRQRDGKDSLDKNEEIFNNCYRILKRNQQLIMFPEGNQQNKKTIRALKKGVGRVAFGAESKYNFELDVQIVPVGINYGHHTKMFSTLHVKYGKPIPLSDFREQFYENEPKALNDLRMRLQNELKDLVINIKNPEYYDTIEEIRLLLPGLLHSEAGVEHGPLDNEIAAGQHFIQAFEQFAAEEPEKATVVKSAVKTIRDMTKSLGLKYHVLQQERHSTLPSFVLLLLTLPVFIGGWITNIIPFYLIGWFVKTKVKDPHFHSSIKMIGGSVLFFIFHQIVATVIGSLFGFSWYLISVASMPVLGYAAFRYWIHLKKTLARLKYNALRKRNDNRITEILCLKSQVKQYLVKMYADQKAVKVV